MKFDELKLDSEILSGVAAAGFEECTEVQARVIPHIIEGRDVMVQSQTGTGKTAAFLLPAFQLLLHNPDFREGTVLVVAPTRELAVQIKEETELLGENLPVKVDVFHGGVGYGGQEKALREGVNIIVGTPGRILDLSQTGTMNLKDIRIMIIDEADRLFDMGFYPDIRKMMRRMRPREERLNMLFSATLSTRVRNLAWEHMNDPVEIEVQPEQITVDKVKQTLYHVSSDEKMSVMLGLLKQKKPRTAIVFTNTKRAAEEISKRLEINGYPSEFIMGDLPQRKRLAIIRKIKAGEAEYLVATDVAARGLHIDNLEMVINYDLPEDPEAYVHRIGRTARAGETGEAVALACERYVFGLESIEKLINQKIPVAELTEELHAEDASAGMRIRMDRDSRDDRGPNRSGRDRPPRRSDGRRSPDSGRGGESRRAPEARRSGDGKRGGESRRAPDNRRGGESRRAPDTRRAPDSRRGPDRRPEGAPSGGVPKASDSLEERLAYYRRKYGEDFQPTDEMLASMQGPGSGGGKRKRSRKGRSSSRKGSGGDRQQSQGRKTSPEASGTDAPRKDSAGKSRPPEQSKKRDAPVEKESPTTKKKGILGKLKSFFE
jgi:ATP-dependent RNA helicase RhlB